jgi:hypothetical protein
METEVRRKIFDLDNFLLNLGYTIEDRPIMIDDVVQTYKDFLSHTSEPLLSRVKDYVNRHSLVTEDEKVKSFIDACHRLNFEK